MYDHRVNHIVAYQEELRRQAEQERLYNLYRRSQPARDPFYHAILASVGHLLTTWGERLEKRYGDVCEACRLPGEAALQGAFDE